MIDLDSLKTCELHVHLGGCLFAEDLLELGREVYEKVDWSLFVRAYEKAFGVRPDPVALFRAALDGDPAGLERFKRHYAYGEEDQGDFSRFQAKFNLAISLYRHWWHVLDRAPEIVRRVLERHRQEGLKYVEYRAMAPYDSNSPEAFAQFHLLNARTLQEGSGQDFAARYLVSLPRWAPLESYLLVCRLMEENPELASTIVGLDFCFFEEGYPPESARPFFERLHRDDHPRLEVAYHVGEVFFDKSLESAIRWCHQAALLGARRLGHCIALGLNPEVAIQRRAEAHEREPASERLAQIRYDLEHCQELAAYGIRVDAQALQEEQLSLSHFPPGQPVRRLYTPERLEEIRARQAFVLDGLVQLGAVIEICPTSNLRIGSVPEAQHHPLHRFLDAGVNLAIGADDPGLFDCTLASEVEWVRRNANLETSALAARLGDPRRFCFDRG
jgi:hypothetical protein